MGSSRLTMTKNYVDGNISEATITVEKNPAPKRKNTNLWPQYGHLKNQRCDGFSLQKANMPELTLIYLCQSSIFELQERSKNVLWRPFYTRADCTLS